MEKFIHWIIVQYCVRQKMSSICSTLDAIPSVLLIFVDYDSPFYFIFSSLFYLLILFFIPPSAAVIYGTDRPEPRLVCRRGQCWPVWRWLLERKSDTGAFPIRCWNWQRVHLLFSQLWNYPAGQSHAGEPRETLHQSKVKTTTQDSPDVSVVIKCV